MDTRSVAAGVLAVLESGLIIRKIASLLFFFDDVELENPRPFFLPSEQNRACRAPVLVRPPGISFMTLRLELMPLGGLQPRRATIQPQ